MFRLFHLLLKKCNANTDMPASKQAGNEKLSKTCFVTTIMKQ